MTQQIIAVGTTADDNTGDPIRVGGQKINANFTELYGAVATKAEASDLAAKAPLASPGLTGLPTAPTAAATTNTTQIATTAMVQSALATYIAAQDVLVFKGAIDCSANPNYPAADAGHVYKVSVAGRIGGASGPKVEINDVLTCSVDGSISGNNASVGANWFITQVNIDGAVVGPSSATDLRVAVFDGTTGKLIKDGGVALAALAPLDSPTFTTVVHVPVPASGDDSDKAASTSWVRALVAAATAGVSEFNGRTGAVETTAADIGASARMLNGSLVESRASNAATYSVKTQAGATPGSGADKVRISFTDASGALVLRYVTSTLLITIPSGTTLGSVSGLTSPLYLYAIDNAGTVELAVSLKHFGDFGTVTTSAISGGSTSTTMYSTTARTAKSFTLLGVAYFSQATAGTWAAAPSSIRLAPLSLKKYGCRVGLAANQTAANGTFVRVNLDTVAFDDDGVWSASSYRYVAQEPGRYQFIGCAASNTGYAAASYVRKNNVVQAAGDVRSGAIGPAQAQGPIDLIPGDYVELFFYQGTGSDNVYGQVSQTWLYGYLLR